MIVPPSPRVPRAATLGASASMRGVRGVRGVRVRVVGGASALLVHCDAFAPGLACIDWHALIAHWHACAMGAGGGRWVRACRDQRGSESHKSWLASPLIYKKTTHTPRGADNRQSPEQGQNRTAQSTGALSRRGWPRQQHGPPVQAAGATPRVGRPLWRFHFFI